MDYRNLGVIPRLTPPSLTLVDRSRGLGASMDVHRLTAIAARLSAAANKVARGYQPDVKTYWETGLITILIPDVWYGPCVSELTEAFHDILDDTMNLVWRIVDDTSYRGTWFYIYVAFAGTEGAPARDEPVTIRLGTPTPPPASSDPFLSFGQEVDAETLGFIADQLENHINDSLNLDTYRCVIPDHGEIQLKIDADVTGELVSAVTDVIDDVLVGLCNVSWEITNYGKNFSIHVAVDGPVPPLDYDDEAPQPLDALENAAFDIQDRVLDHVADADGRGDNNFSVSVDYEVHSIGVININATLWVSIDFDPNTDWEPSITVMLTIIRTLLWANDLFAIGSPYIITGDGIQVDGDIRRWVIGQDVTVRRIEYAFQPKGLKNKHDLS